MLLTLERKAKFARDNVSKIMTAAPTQTHKHTHQ